jgi:hypothetical protein
MDYGMKEKIEAGRMAYRMSRLQMIQNIEDSRTTDVKETIFGRGPVIEKPILYPQVCLIACTTLPM